MNLGTIHEIEHTDSIHFIATEFIEGQTLRQRIVDVSIKPSEVLDVAVQIAAALSAAHAAGIVHRDIKPENIMVRRDGIVKVLDFGLAKLTGQEEPGLEDPTRAMVKTSTGVVMGTVTYMSPEQARGLPLDARTDIWSLGVVLYEMLTGRPPFEGATTSDMIVSILEREPRPLATSSPEVPEALEWIVSKALTKEREDRYQTARELLTDLRRIKQRLEIAALIERSGPPQSATGITDFPSSSGGSTAAPALVQSQLPIARRPGRDKRIAAAALGVLLLLVLIVGGVGLFKWTRQQDRKAAEPAGVSRNQQITTWPGLDFFPSFSPDGSAIAYASDRNGSFEIYVKQLAPGGREIQITSDGAQNFEPAWSPDGKLIAYHSKNHNGVWTVPALGGLARQITEFGSSPAWSPDGSLIAFQSAGIGDNLTAVGSGALLPSVIWTVSIAGGAPEQITQVGNPPGGHGTPSWSPDGTRIVFGVFDPGKSEVWSVAANGDQLKLIAKPGFDPVYAPDGQTVYFLSVRNQTPSIWKVGVSQRTGEVVGSPVELGQIGPSKRLAVSADGKKLAYSALSQTSNLWSIPMSPVSNDAIGPPVSLTRETSYRVAYPVFSPDGKKISYTVIRGGTVRHIWLMNSDGSNPVQLTTDPAGGNWPNWFPNGDQLAFQSTREGRSMLWSVAVNGGKEKPLLDPGQEINFPRLSPDGKWIVFNSNKSGTSNLWIVPIQGGQPKQLTFDKESVGFAAWSPDGQFLAFEVKRGDDNYAAIMPSAGGQVTQLTSDHGLSWPHSWSPDGDKIAFAGARNALWDVYSVSRSSGAQKKLTTESKLGGFVRYPAWSPQGNQIVYEYAQTTGNIWLMELK